MKKRSFIPIFMSGLMLVQTAFPVFASDLTTSDVTVTGDGRQTEQSLVTYQDEILKINCLVSIPKKIYLDKTTKSQDYQITAKGNLNQETSLKVRPVDGIEDTSEVDFYMKRQDKSVADVVATVTQAETEWTNEEVTADGASKPGVISVPDITPGVWEGNLQFGIGLYDTITGSLKVHEHVYGSTGRCECGQLDPDHVHSYDAFGECVCGNATAISSVWDYTLNETDNTITLKQYKGGAINVIVHGTYDVGGKTYQTKLASNTEESPSNRSQNYMFGRGNYRCSLIQSITFEPTVDTSEVTDMAWMFNDCRSLTHVDVSGFDTRQVTSMEAMFYNCPALTSLDLTGFDTTNVTRMDNMFNGSSALESVFVSSAWKTADSATDMFRDAGVNDVTVR